VRRGRGEEGRVRRGKRENRYFRGGGRANQDDWAADGFEVGGRGRPFEWRFVVRGSWEDIVRVHGWGDGLGWKFEHLGVAPSHVISRSFSWNGPTGYVVGVLSVIHKTQ
jgi:hypothetical protein